MRIQIRSVYDRVRSDFNPKDMFNKQKDRYFVFRLFFFPELAVVEKVGFFFGYMQMLSIETGRFSNGAMG
jgi:hypothetical protein